MFRKSCVLPLLYNKLQLNLKHSNCIKKINDNHTNRTRRCSSNFFMQFNTNASCAAKIFVEAENTYLYKILPPQIYNLPLNTSREKTTVSNVEELYTILDKNWRVQSVSSIVSCFRQIQDFCCVNNINISNTHFDKLVDGLMDHVEELSDEEMIELLEILGRFPKTDSYQSHNFHDVWSALDDICCNRIPSWDKDMLFRIADLWFKLHCSKIGDFVLNMLDKLTNNSKSMTVNELVRCFFYFNVCRRKPIDFMYENAVKNTIDSMTVDQIAIVALGFFKAKCRIKLPEIINRMIEAVIKNKETVDDITLCGILKAVRFSANVHTGEQTYALLATLAGQIDRISWQCALHTALLGTTLQVYHSETLERCCKRFLSEYAKGNTGRLKDIERLLIPVTMFNHTTEAGEATVKTAFNDLHMAYRSSEMAQYPRCAPTALSFCSMRGLYSNTLMNQYLNKEFIKEVYGTAKSVSRELFALDSSIDLDCPDYPINGSRLSRNDRRKAAKWQCEWKPNEIRGKPTALDSVALDMAEHLGVALGDHNKYLWVHILPQYAKADLIICKNLSTNEFIRPPLDDYVLGDVIKASSVDKEGVATLQFYAIVLLGINHVIRRTNIPLGIMEMKRRQLITAGYKPIYVISSHFRELSSENKIKYIKTLLN